MPTDPRHPYTLRDWWLWFAVVVTTILLMALGTQMTAGIGTAIAIRLMYDKLHDREKPDAD